ncbi:MAG: LPS-assembly protein LptD [Acidiferrobacterales bacterium]|nr:LPS-assembly protein LptD [Acidiferrobacterales bacterium]
MTICEFSNKAAFRKIIKRILAPKDVARLILLIVIISSLGVKSAFAACENVGCACQPSIIQFASPTMQPGENGKYPIALEADNVEAQGDELVTLSGNAEVIQGRQTIVADELQYYRETDRVVATGNVEIISESGDYISSDSIDVIAPSQIGTLTNTQFKLSGGLTREDGIDTVVVGSRGSAEILNLEGEGITTLENATYTTCPEGNNSVLVKAGFLELDDNAGVGIARNATVRFFGLPIVYLPYISFPINDERKTGLLTPSFGSDRDSGEIIEIPWYWNIAKNQDATITPVYYTERGAQIRGEYRHKSLNSDTLLYAEVLPDDELFGEDRDLFTIEHYQRFTDNLTGFIEYNDVSDVEYFNDLSNDISRFSASYVPRDVTLAYNSDYLYVSARANQYQIIDSSVSEQNQPYERLPQISFFTKLPDGPLGMEYGVIGSYTDFASDFNVEGSRASLSPYASLPFENLWGYVEPKVSVHTRSYSLSNVEEGQDESPSFTVPVFSLDMGIALEKNTTWLGEDALHTLSPRVFYVYAPNEDQSGVPSFDTRPSTFNSLSGIFRENRFSGEDRIGDMNQVTVGLSTEIIDSNTGDRRLSASIGQLYIIDDLEQNLVEDTVIESGLGDLLAEFRIEGEHAWSAAGFFQYDHDESDLEKINVAVAYRPKSDSRKIVQLAYYVSKNFDSDTATDQLILSGFWPINDHWSFFANERYSFEDSESLSRTLGFEYDGCCWKVRFISSEGSRSGGLEDKNQYYFVELELNSIGGIGQQLLF